MNAVSTSIFSIPIRPDIKVTPFNFLNKAVCKHLETLFIGTSVLFMSNIFFGFDNSLTADELPRWQVLIDLHRDSIG
ncbi:MAG: hypothetical protein ACK2U3_06435 [Anaerolineales bacterium]